MNKNKILILSSIFLIVIFSVVFFDLSNDGKLNLANPLEKSDELVSMDLSKNMIDINAENLGGDLNIEEGVPDETPVSFANDGLPRVKVGEIGNDDLNNKESNFDSDSSSNEKAKKGVNVEENSKVSNSSDGDNNEKESFLENIKNKIVNIFSKNKGSSEGSSLVKLPNKELNCRTEKLPCNTVVESGQYFSCALLSGEVKCWGDNRSGQIGNGSIGGFSLTPTIVSGINDAVDVSAGILHACAIVGGGKVKCWGDNKYGQLGNGSFGGNTTTPTMVSGLSNIVSISAGNFHTCGTSSSGALWCWGDNKYGQLGTGNNTPSNSPVLLTLPNVSNVSAGLYGTCAVSGTQGYCWGWNEYGQVGTGGVSTMVLSPSSIFGLSNISQISLGNTHLCAINQAGSVLCLGDNQYGQLGNGNTINQLAPVSNGITNAVFVSSGISHTCAVLSNGEGKCWGLNKSGQLGNGVFSGINSTPQNVLNVPNLVFVSTKSTHTCGVTKDLILDGDNNSVDILCWGSGYNGALGNGSINDSNVRVFAIEDHACCWKKISKIGEPSPRAGNTIIWTGDEMIIWGGQNSTISFNDGAKYNPTTNTWVSVSPSPLSPRQNHIAVWTGSEMIIWGGRDSFNNFTDGAIYNPTTNSWTMLPSSPITISNLPSGIWTGSEMIVWAGLTPQSSGAKYNPSNNSWSLINSSSPDTPSPRRGNLAIWTGDKMIIWGGITGTNHLSDGSMYDPVLDNWYKMDNTNSPFPRANPFGAWNTKELFVWGGATTSSVSPQSLGKKYDPTQDSWINICHLNQPDRSYNVNYHQSGIWTGKEFIIWGWMPSTTNQISSGVYKPL